MNQAIRFLKRHYEKLILSLVLLALAVAAAWLPTALSDTRVKLRGASATPPLPKPYKPLDLASTMAQIGTVQAPPKLVLNGEHNLFNPVVWKKKYDGSLFKITTGNEEGAGAVTVVKIVQLHFIIAFNRVAGSGYYLDVTREIWPDPRKRRKQQVFISKTSNKADWFTLQSVKGTEEDPILELELLNGNKELAEVTKEKPYDKVEGYAVDLKYDLEGKHWDDLREDPKGGRPLIFAGDAYKVVYIGPSEVRLMANSNNKQTTIRWKSAP